MNFALLRTLVFPAEGEPAYERLMPKNRWRLLPWLLPVVYWGWLAVSWQAEVMTWPKLKAALGPADPDVWLRLSQVRQWITGGGFYDHAVRNTNAPFGGIETHWTRPMDALLALFTQFMPSGIAIEQRLMLAAAWLPPVLGIFALVFLTRAALRRFDHVYVVWTMMALMTLSPLTSYFMPGDADHHGLLAMLWCGVLCLLMRPLTVLSGYAVGTVLGVMMWVSVESLLPLAAVYSILGLHTLKDPERMKPLACLTLGAAVAALFGLMNEVPPERLITGIVYDTLSLPHVTLLFFIAAGAGVLSLPMVRQSPLSLRLVCIACVMALAAIFQLALFPKMIMGPMVDTHYFISTHFLKGIVEAQPLLLLEGGVIVRHFLLPVFALVLVLVTWRHTLHRDKLWALSVLLLITLGMTLAQGRWTYFVQPVAMVMIAGFLPAVARIRGRSEVEMFFIWAAVFFVVTLSAPVGKPSSESQCQSQMRYAIQTGQLQRKVPNENAVIYAEPALSGDILFFTPYRIIAGNYHREGQGLSDLYDIARETNEQALQKRLATRQAEAMLYCPETQEIGSVLLTPPRWLKPAGKLDIPDMAGPKPQVFTIDWEK